MHRFKAVFCALLSAAFLSGAGQAPPQRRIDFTPEQQAALDKVSAYLNGVHSLKSGFIHQRRATKVLTAKQTRSGRKAAITTASRKDV